MTLNQKVILFSKFPRSCWQKWVTKYQSFFGCHLVRWITGWPSAASLRYAVISLVEESRTPVGERRKTCSIGGQSIVTKFIWSICGCCWWASCCSPGGPQAGLPLRLPSLGSHPAGGRCIQRQGQWDSYGLKLAYKPSSQKITQSLSCNSGSWWRWSWHKTVGASSPHFLFPNEIKPASAILSSFSFYPPQCQTRNKLFADRYLMCVSIYMDRPNYVNPQEAPETTYNKKAWEIAPCHTMWFFMLFQTASVFLWLFSKGWIFLVLFGWTLFHISSIFSFNFFLKTPCIGFRNISW